MNLLDLVTSYKQIKEPVEKTYTAATGKAFPASIKIDVAKLKDYRKISEEKYGIAPDIRETPLKPGASKAKTLYYGNTMQWLAPESLILILNNPAFKVIHDAFRGIGIAEYHSIASEPKNDMLFLSARLYEDELGAIFTKNFSPSYRLFIEAQTKTSREAQLVASVRSKVVQLPGLPEKMEMVAKCGSLEELEKELDTLV